MSDENFFARWSRRKAEAAKADTQREADSATPPEPNDAAADARAEAGSLARAPESPPAAADVTPFDPEDLPPIDSIGPDTDVSVFLRPGVPAELARAALRRAWTTDPTIRDYIGLSENAWDFTAPQGVPGFGPLSPEDAQRLLAAFTGRRQEAAADACAAEPPGPASSDEAQKQPGSEESGIGPNRNQIPTEETEGAGESPEPRAAQPAHALSPSEGDVVAAQHIHADPMPHPARSKSALRRGGGALPK